MADKLEIAKEEKEEEGVAGLARQSPKVLDSPPQKVGAVHRF